MDINFETMSDLNRTVNASFRGALAAAAEPEWSRIATRIRSGSSQNLYPFLGETDGMREWLGDAVFDQLASHRYAIPNRKFQKGLTAHRDQIADDADGGAGLYGSQAEIIARACASHPDELVIGETLTQAETLLCHDGQPFFDDSHPNQNGDGGTQDNTMGGAGTAWYLLDTSKPILPLIYQLREDIRLDRLFDLNNAETFFSHQFYWNAWMRDAAGFGVWWTAVKSQQTLDEANFVAARERLEQFHIGVKDPLTGTYRSARNTATLLLIPQSLRESARKLFMQRNLATGESNYLNLDPVEIMVSKYL